MLEDTMVRRILQGLPGVPRKAPASPASRPLTCPTCDGAPLPGGGACPTCHKEPVMPQFRLYAFARGVFLPVCWSLATEDGVCSHRYFVGGGTASPDSLDAEEIGPAVAAIMARCPGVVHVRVERAEE